MLAGADLDVLWERLRQGDRSAATRIIEQLLESGNEGGASLAGEAIARHFSRAAREAIEAARQATGAERDALTEKAIEALLAASLSRQLPSLLANVQSAGNGSTIAGFPIPNIIATGLVSGIKLTWLDTAVPVGVLAVRAQAIDSTGTTVADSGVVNALLGLIQLNGLTPGYNYVVSLTAFSNDAESVASMAVQAGTLALATANPVSGLAATPVLDGLQLSWTNPTPPTGSTLSGLTMVVVGLGSPQVFNYTGGSLPTSQTVTSLAGGNAYGVVIQPIYNALGTSTLGPIATLTAIPLVPTPPLPPVLRPITVPQGFPIPNLLAAGIPGGVLLQWLGASVPEGVYGIQTQAFDQTGKLADTGIVSSLLGQSSITGLTDGCKYLLRITTMSDAPSVTECVVQAGTLAVQNLPGVSNLVIAPNTAANGLAFAWTNPTPPAGTTLTGLVVTLAGGGVTQVFNYPTSTPASLQAANLTSGAPYTIAIQPLYSVAGIPALGILQYLTALAGASPLSGTPFAASIPQLPADPILFLDPSTASQIENAIAMLTTAGRIGGKFTYDFLKEQALRAATDALGYDSQIVNLMGMTLSKAQTAAGEFSPAVLAAMAGLQKDSQVIGAVASATPVTDAINTLSGDVAKYMMLEAILIWLASTDAFDVWIGFFEALIEDICSFNTSFSHVRDFFASQENVFNLVLKSIAQAELNQVNAKVDEAVAPIMSAVAGIIGASSTQMGRVFASFDLPLLMSQQSNPANGNVLVPNVNPLNTDLANLQSAVAALAEQLKSELRQSLQGIIDGTADSLFLDILIAYLVTPLVIALAVAIAGGPIAAAILAAIIAISAEELLSLIAGWLTGPLNSQLTALANQVQNDMLALVTAIRNQVPLTSLVNPTSVLSLAENQLRELGSLMPQAFLEDIAALLGAARGQRLQDAIASALAAEQAIGFENATAFDRIRYAYQTLLTPAPQLPGAKDPSLLSAAALLADIGRVEQDLAQVADGKELQITRRLSLFQLLGGQGDPLQAAGTALGQFASFLQSGECALALDPATLLDESAPGAYRALITDVSLLGISKLPSLAAELLGSALSITVTHSGDSWTRIKHNANTAAPPIAMPAGFPDRTAFALAASYRNQAPAPNLSPNSIEAKIWSIITGMTTSASWDNIRKACLAMLPQAIADLGNIVYTGLIGATASSQQTGNEAYHVLHEDRTSYYSSQPQTSQSTPVTLTVELGNSSEVITGIRLWPRPQNVGFPGLSNISVSVSDDGTAGSFRPIQYPVTGSVPKSGSEAYYMHFAPAAGRYVQIQANALAQIGTQWFFQLCNVQVETMNVVVNELTLSSPATNSQDPAHPVTNLVDGDPSTYYSTTTYNAPNPSPAPYFTVTMPDLAPLMHVRLLPRQDGPSGNFPSGFRIQLRGKDTIPYRFQNFAITGNLPVDFYFPAYQTGTWFFTTDAMAQIAAGQYALQLAEMTASSCTYRPSLISAAAVRSVIGATLSAMTWPPQSQIDPVQASAAIANAVASGMSGSGISSLSDVAGTVWDDVWNEWMGRVAKWNGAQVQNDPNPSVRALNFVRLRRSSDAEAVTLDLFPSQASSSPTQSGVMLLPLGREVFTDSRQYKPFQNLGLGGVLNVSAPQIANWAIADLIVQVTMRACYSDELAACVRSGRTQIGQQIGRANLVGAAVGRSLSLGQAAIQTGTSGVRSVKFSLRTQRDRIYQSAIAAAQLQQGSTIVPGVVTVDNLKFTPSQTSALNLGDPFAFFGTDGSGAPIPGVITLAFTQAQTSTLFSQMNTIAVTPQTLGVDLSLLQNLTQLAGTQTPTLMGLAIILVPIGNMGAPFTATAGATDGGLNTLLGSSWVQGQPIPLITMTSPAVSAANPILLKDLWPTSGSRSLTFDVSNAITNNQLYDVIVSVSYLPPALTALIPDAGALL